MRIIANAGIDHIVVDYPSVDKEQDGGKLAAYKASLRYPYDIR